MSLMGTHWNVGKLSKQVRPLKQEIQSLLRMGWAWKFKSTATRSDSWHFSCWPSAELYVLSKYQVMPLHIAHVKEGLIPLHFPPPNLHTSMDSLCLSWHITGAGVVNTELETQWLFIHLVQSLQGDCSSSPFTSVDFGPSQKGRETRATTATDLLHLHGTSDTDIHSLWHFGCHWKKVLT